MFSSDKNIQSITQLIEAIKDYISLEKECVKLDLIEKLVRLSSALIIFMLIFVLSVGVLFYLSFSFVYWMAPTIGWVSAFMAVAAIFFVLIIIVVCKRKLLIERPLTWLFADIFLKK